MGQSSSSGSKAILPSTNLLIDCSDSYVTDVKLRSSSMVPISEYIKKDKCNKIQHFDDSKRRILPKQSNMKNGKLVGILKDGKKCGRTKTPGADKKDKEKFLESSFEDLPNQRKWVSAETTPGIPNKKLKDEDFSSMKVNNSVVSENVKQLYKNNVYPHIYKNNYIRKLEQKEQQKKTIPVGNYYPKTSPKSKRRNNTKWEESTHELNQHNYERQKWKGRRNKVNLSIQTNVACVIHPDRSRQVRRASSDEMVKKQNKSCRRKRNTSDTEISLSSHTVLASQVKKFEKTRREPKITLSGKEALESWKNAHSMKQRNEEEKFKKQSRSSKRLSPIPSKHRTRAGYRDKSKSQPQRKVKMSPLEESNYNYIRGAKSEYLTPHEIKQRNERMKNKRRESSYCPKHEAVEHTGYKDYDEYSDTSDDDQMLNREDFIADIERCLQKRYQTSKKYRPRSANQSTTTWVQDKHRRWHKVVIQ